MIHSILLAHNTQCMTGQKLQSYWVTSIILSLVHDTDRHSKQHIWVNYIVQGPHSNTCLIPFRAQIAWEGDAICNSAHITLPKKSLHMTSRGEASCKNHQQSLPSAQRMGTRSCPEGTSSKVSEICKELHSSETLPWPYSETACLISYWMADEQWSHRCQIYCTAFI